MSEIDMLRLCAYYEAACEARGTRVSWGVRRQQGPVRVGAASGSRSSSTAVKEPTCTISLNKKANAERDTSSRGRSTIGRSSTELFCRPPAAAAPRDDELSAAMVSHEAKRRI